MSPKQKHVKKSSPLEGVTVDAADVRWLLRIEPGSELECYVLRDDGFYLDRTLFDDDLSPEERAALAELPGGEGGEGPSLKLPCSLADLEAFLEASGNYGYIDPFDAFEFVLTKASGLPLPASTDRSRLSQQRIEDVAKERNTLIKLFGAAVESGYAIKLGQRNERLSEMLRDFRGRLPKLTDKTLRKYLDLAAASLGEEAAPLE